MKSIFRALASAGLLVAALFAAQAGTAQAAPQDTLAVQAPGGATTDAEIGWP
ncbi:hypothetical protein [Kitasatospora fiedleri]|uniref:hypothetical protein n=1 Tax=Kitasatospora fiedleri TaxID=2991545 RepID=UPI00249B8C36|nr:hypothetical protein [Kitasatospora fiedleri]